MRVRSRNAFHTTYEKEGTQMKDEHVCAWCGTLIEKDERRHQEGVNGNTIYFHETLQKNCYEGYLHGIAAQAAARLTH